MTIPDLLQFANVLLLPILYYIVRVEVRLTKIETLQSAEYVSLMSRVRGGDKV